MNRQGPEGGRPPALGPTTQWWTHVIRICPNLRSTARSDPTRLGALGDDAAERAYGGDSWAAGAGV